MRNGPITLPIRRERKSHAAGGVPGGYFLHSPSAIKVAARLAGLHAAVINIVVLIAAADAGMMNSLTVWGAVIGFVWAPVLAFLPWHKRSHNWIAKVYLLGAATFMIAAVRFDNPYLLLGIYPETIALADIYWYRRSALVTHLGLLFAGFTACAIVIAPSEVAWLLIAAPFMLVSALFFGKLSDHLVRSLLARTRFSSTVRSLLRALYVRDGYTWEHSEVTVSLVSAVADELDLDTDTRSELAEVALLHDIGKIGIPNSILQKPGKLSEEQWRVMRTHPLIGERILRDVPGFENVAKAIRHEHERWDGHGYPDGIRAEEIPLSSRIVLACDAFHAMVSNRPYRDAMEVEHAREELAANAGSQFDPNVIVALLAALDKGRIDLQAVAEHPHDVGLGPELSERPPAAMSAVFGSSDQESQVSASANADASTEARTADEAESDSSTPLDPRTRMVLNVAGWLMTGVLSSIYVAAAGLDPIGAAFAVLSFVLAATTLAFGNTRESRDWTVASGLVAFAVVPYVAWKAGEPSMLFFLVIPAILTCVALWDSPRARIGLVVLMVVDFLVLPMAIVETTPSTFAAVSARVFPGVILIFAYLFPRIRDMSFDRLRFKSTMDSLLQALQARDGYTGEHSEQTVAMALQVADKLRLTERERSDLRDVAVLHDIGKIGIPDEILHKPGRLDDAEWETMRQHPAIGEGIVAEIPGFREIATAIRHEHERWDGAGYPDGLAGADIPLASRVVLVCDAYHAMTSDRPYRKALGPDVARHELLSNAGTQFDPTVVGALLAVIDEQATAPVASIEAARLAHAANL